MPSTDYLIQLDSHLAAGHQAWLFGAGISIGANIPLMGALTSRTFDILAPSPAKALLDAVKQQLPPTAHIEHILSQIGDYAAIAERSKQTALIGNLKISLPELKLYHDAILQAIGDTIRWGYKAASATAKEEIGKPDSTLVNVDEHRQFVKALLGRSQAGVADRRHPVKFFTTNYDTLIEDALSLEP